MKKRSINLAPSVFLVIIVLVQAFFILTHLSSSELLHLTFASLALIVAIYLVFTVTRKDAIKKSKIYMDDVLSSMMEMLIVINEKKQIDLVNKSVLSTLGFEKNDLKNKSFELIINESESILSSLFENRSIDKEEKIFKRKNGDEIPVIFSATPLKDSENNIKGAVCVAMNITKRKKAEAKIRIINQIQSEKNKLLQIALEELSLPQILDKVLRSITSIPWLNFDNKALIYLTDREIPEQLFLKAYLGDYDKVEKFEKISVVDLNSEEIVAKCAKEKAIQHSDKDSESNLLASPILNAANDLIGVIAIGVKNREFPIDYETDFLQGITNTLSNIINNKTVESEKEMYQKQLMQAGKLASLGELAGGVAHELNNPLAVIQTDVDLIESELGESKPSLKDIHEYSASINKNIERMVSIISHLKTFARQKDITFESSHLHEIIDTALSLFGKQFQNRNIEINKKYSKKNIVISCDSNQIEQVFINLLTNARDALEDVDKKQITITTRASKSKIIIKFEDTGPGVRHQESDKIFDPFYTTKAEGKGTGLGLSIAHGIIKNHNGTIILDEYQTGKGASFLITLPSGQTK